MAVPTINDYPTSIQEIAVGVAVSIQLAATESPSSWAATGLPDGLSIDSSGEITGTPTTQEATDASITATNASGTSSAVVITFAVFSQPAGSVQDEITWELDLDMILRQVRVPGVTDWAPQGIITRDPVTLRCTENSERPFATWETGENYDILIGVRKFGVLQALTLNRVELDVRYFANDGDSIELIADPTDITAVGSGAEKRFQTAVLIDPDDFAELDDYEDADGCFLDFLAQLTLEASIDHRDFSSGPTTEAITSINEGDTKTHTFSIDLDSSTLATADYDVTAEVVFPTASGLNVSLPVIVNAAWGGSAFTASILSGDEEGTGTNGSNWGTAFSITSVAGDADGFNVALEVVSDAQKKLLLELENGTTDGSTLAMPGTPDEWHIKDSEGTDIFTFGTTDGMTPAQVAAAFLSGAGEVVSVTFESPDQMSIELPADTAIVSWEHTGSFTTGDVVASGPTFTDAFFRITVAGREMPEQGQRIRSRVFPLRIERKLG